MNIFAQARASILSWAHATPLPSTNQAHPTFQSWHHFDPVLQWISLPSNARRDHAEPTRGRNTDLVLLTWNIDATSPRTQERITDIVTLITGLDPKVDIVFLQEVSRPALQQILKDERVRESWFSSERDDAAWGKQPFATMILLSKGRCAPYRGSQISNAVLGPIWRVKYPSHFDRDALCCDIFLSSLQESEHSTMRIRLVNVHLDSLPIKPSHRPRQISIVSALLRVAGRGLVAGDFNPVLEEDATLLGSNGLTDVWTSLHPEEPGYTWGIHGEHPFPPNRLDKVAVLGLKPYNIKILEPNRLGDSNTSRFQQTDPIEDTPLWSDHHALLCSFGLVKSE